MTTPVRPGAPHRARRPAAALAILLTLLTGLFAVGVRESRPADAARPLATIALSELEPAIARPDGELRVAGVVTGGRERLRDVRVALRLSQTPVNSRAELAGVASGLTTGKDGEVIAETAVPDVATDTPAEFSLTRQLRSLDVLGDFGVYVLSVEVTARHRTGEGRVAITRTFLPWVPRQQSFQPTSLAWLWPLAGEPARQADGRYQDDNLATEMAPGGRLSRLTDAGGRLAARLPITWAVDGDLLDSAEDMSNGYRVQDEPAVATQPGAAVAAQWLAQARAATTGHDVMPLPYADPDLPALRRNGLSDDIATAATTSASVLARVLRRDQIRTDLTWPSGGSVDRKTLALLGQDGTDAVVLDGAAQPTRLQLNYTPTGRSVVNTPDGPMTSLVADSGLTGLLANQGASPLLAAQRFLAETAMITAELPSSGGDRVVLAAPPTRWNPSQVFLDRLVSGVSEAPWISGTSLTQMRAASPGEVERRGVRYPASARRAELSKSYLAAVRSQHDRIDLVAKVLDPREPSRTAMLSSLSKSVLRLESTWWRSRDDARVNRISDDQGYLAGQRPRVGFLSAIAVQPGSYTLGSRSGKVPLTITNGTNRAIVVTLRVEPQNRRLRLDPPEGPIRIPARRKVQRDVRATAVAAGPVVVDATLLTTDGTPLSTAPVQLTIRITQIGTVALVITLSAAGVLFLAAFIRIGRRALRGPAFAAPGAGGAVTDAGATASAADDASESGLLRSSSVMAVGTAVSRMLGFVRSAVIVAALGIHLTADTFAVANTVPNIIYILLAGGVLNAVFVPQLVRAMKQPDAGRAYSDRLLTLAFSVLAAVTLVATLAAPLIIRLYSGRGWTDADTAVSTAFAFWCLPQIFFYGLYTLVGQVLNARGSFGPMMWAPIVNNLVAIAGGLLFIALFTVDDRDPSSLGDGAIALLGGSATLGVVLQALVLLPVLHRTGFRWRPRWDFRGQGLGKAGDLAKWTLLFVLVNQLAYIVIVRLATNAGTEGFGYAAYTNAYLIFILPHSIITVSVVTGLLPRMSRAASDGRLADLRDDLSTGWRLSAVGTVLVASVLVALGPELTGVLFSAHNSAVDARAIGVTTAAFALGLPAFSAQYVVLRGFYAQEDTRTPFHLQVAIAATNVVLALFAYTVAPVRWQVTAMALAYAATYGVGLALSTAVLRRRLGGVDGPRVVRAHVRLLAAAGPPAVLAWLIARLVTSRLGEETAGSLAASLAGGAVLVTGFLVAARLMRIPEVGALTAMVRGRVAG